MGPWTLDGYEFRGFPKSISGIIRPVKAELVIAIFWDPIVIVYCELGELESVAVSSTCAPVACSFS